MAAADPQTVTTRDRWLGALCYASVLVIVSLLQNPKSPFLARHCRQGFALLFAEIVLGLVVLVIEAVLQPVPVLGVLVTVILHLAYVLLFLGLSVLGFLKAIAGEDYTVVGLEDIADRIPID